MIETISKIKAWQHILGPLSTAFAKGSFVTSAVAQHPTSHLEQSQEYGKFGKEPANT